MADTLTLEQIRAYWTEQARVHGESPAASWSDASAIDLEIREIANRLHDGDRVLDIGCGNGYSTVQFAARKRISIRGIDYVPVMVHHARARAAALSDRLATKPEFDVGDVTALQEPANAYDKVVCVRVIINLRDWPTQRAALLAVGRVVKPGGLLLLSEATVQGWKKLNAFRAEWGLAQIPMPPFNAYLDEDDVTRTLSTGFDLIEVANFASTYFVGTRVLKPLLAQALNASVNVADPAMHWNQWWAQLPPFGDYGTQKLFVFRKQ